MNKIQKLTNRYMMCSSIYFSTCTIWLRYLAVVIPAEGRHRGVAGNQILRDAGSRACASMGPGATGSELDPLCIYIYRPSQQQEV